LIVWTMSSNDNTNIIPQTIKKIKGKIKENILKIRGKKCII